jgi:hypothetical protein
VTRLSGGPLRLLREIDARAYNSRLSAAMIIAGFGGIVRASTEARK